MRPRRARLGAFAPCAGTRRTRASAPASANPRLTSKASPRRGTPHAQSRAATHKRSICPTASATRPLLSPRMSRATHSSGQTCTFHRTNPERVSSAFQPTPIRTPNKIRMLPPRFTSRDLKTRTPSQPFPGFMSCAPNLKNHAPTHSIEPPAHPTRAAPLHTYSDLVYFQIMVLPTFRLWFTLLSDCGVSEDAPEQPAAARQRAGLRVRRRVGRQRAATKRFRR